MKTLFKMFLGLCICSQVFAAPIRLSEPVAQDQETETFGQQLDESLPILSMETLVNEPTIHLGQPFQTQVRIAKVCQKKGCFFIAQQEQHILRVSFRDYEFFIPTDSRGKTVTLTGELIQKSVSAEQSAHLNADLKSDTKVIQPGVVYEIVADSIRIPRG